MPASAAVKSYLGRFSGRQGGEDNRFLPGGGIGAGQEPQYEKAIRIVPIMTFWCYALRIFRADSSFASHTWGMPVSWAVSRFPAKRSLREIWESLNFRAPAMSC